MGGEPACAVVIVTHNTKDHVVRALESLPARGGREVIVVDTGSSDGTVATVRALRADVRVIELENTGFGRAANTGVRAAQADVVVIANADVRFCDGAVEALCHAVRESPGIAAAGPQVRYPDGSLQASARAAISPQDAIRHAFLGRWAPRNRWTRRYHAAEHDPDAPRDAMWLSGCAFAVRREVFDAVGGFDPGYFLYVEDVDLGERLRGRGWRLRYEPGALVMHAAGASTSQRRGRALLTHARSIDRYVAGRAAGWRGAAARIAIRPALAAWIGATWAAERVLPGRSVTGERHGGAA